MTGVQTCALPILWEYVFYIDIEGHALDAKVARALKDVERKAAFVKNLGSYPVAS